MEEISAESVLYLPKLFFKKIEDFYICLNPDMPNIMVLDEVGKEIFELCNGKHKINEIVEHLCNKDSSDKTTREEATKFISTLIKAGFLKTSLSTSTKKEAKQYPKKLFQVYLHLTHKCNLRCKHCHVSAGIPHIKEMSDRRILTLIEELSNIGVERFNITGGEPFLRRDLLYNTVRKAKDYGFQRIDVETNGTLITDEDAHFLKQHSIRAGVSLDGATPESHDFIRGQGTFKRTLNGITSLVEAGVYTSIGMTLMRHNLDEAEKMVYLAKKLNVNQITLNPIVMKGRSKEYPELAVPLENLSAVFKKVWKTAKKTGIKTNVEEFSIELKDLHRKDMCGAGVGIFSIDANGDVYPCNFFLGTSLKAGNIENQSFLKVLENSPILEEFRCLSVLDTECHDCELKFICSGCPAESFEAYGDIKKRTPMCFIRREIVWDTITELSHELWREIK